MVAGKAVECRKGGVWTVVLKMDEADSEQAIGVGFRRARFPGPEAPRSRDANDDSGDDRPQCLVLLPGIAGAERRSEELFLEGGGYR